MIIAGPGVFVPARYAPLLAEALRRLGAANGGLPGPALQLLADLTAAANAHTTGSGSGSSGSPPKVPRRSLVDVTHVGTGRAAELANVTDRAVRDWCEAGAIEAQKVGNRWVIDRATLTDYISGRDNH